MFIVKDNYQHKCAQLHVHTTSYSYSTGSPLSSIVVVIDCTLSVGVWFTRVADHASLSRVTVAQWWHNENKRGPMIEGLNTTVCVCALLSNR